jgi:hypothetical protein
MTEWIGVDFDGTLAEYTDWSGWNVFGKPIPLMVERIKRWIAEGKEVRIVTARIGLPVSAGNSVIVYEDEIKSHTCKISGETYSDWDMFNAIQAYTLEHVGEKLGVQCYKDYNMIELWDDRAVQVIPNTGQTLAEEHTAQLVALKGKAYNPNAGNYSDQDDPKTNPNPI